jgi:DNA-binding NtrC family response regulator
MLRSGGENDSLAATSLAPTHMSDTPIVLVLDDDEGVRTSMASLLKLYGYEAVTASTLDEAHTLLGSTVVQALILDVGLKDGSNGLDLLRTIRQRREFDKAAVLILTGGVLSPSEEVFIKRSRAFVFYKPEGFDTLARFLDDLTGRDRPH